MVPTEWQDRTTLGDCISKANVITVQAPQHRQHALISDFLDLANPSLQEEAALATNWIDDRLEGLTLQNFALATMAGPVMNSLRKILLRTSSTLFTNADLWAKENNWSFTAHRQLQGISPRKWQSFEVIFCRMCTSSAVCYFGAPSVTILTSLRPAVNPLPGCSSGKPVQDQLP